MHGSRALGYMEMYANFSSIKITYPKYFCMFCLSLISLLYQPFVIAYFIRFHYFRPLYLLFFKRLGKHRRGIDTRLKSHPETDKGNGTKPIQISN